MWPFKWKLLSSTFIWYCLPCCTNLTWFQELDQLTCSRAWTSHQIYWRSSWPQQFQECWKINKLITSTLKCSWKNFLRTYVYWSRKLFKTQFALYHSLSQIHYHHKKKNYKKKLKPDLNNNITPSVFKQVLNQSKERR